MPSYSGNGKTYLFLHLESQNFGYLDPVRPQAPNQHFGAQGSNIGPPTMDFSVTGPPSYDRYRQHHCCGLYQQTASDSFPHLKLLHLVVNLFLWLQTQNIAIPARHILGCVNVIADQLSRPREPAHHNRVESPPLNSEPNIWDLGNSSSDMFATVHNTHLPQFMPPISEASSIDALSQDWQGEVNVHVSM